MLVANVKPEIRAFYNWMYATVTRGHEMTDQATGETYTLTFNDADALHDMWTDVLNNVTYDTMGRILRSYIDADVVLSAYCKQRMGPSLRISIRNSPNNHYKQLFAIYTQTVRRDFPALAHVDDIYFEQVFDCMLDLWIDNELLNETSAHNPDGSMQRSD